MVAIQRLGYLCQAMSSAEIFAVLFGGGVIRIGYDRFILSPGLSLPKTPSAGVAAVPESEHDPL